MLANVEPAVAPRLFDANENQRPNGRQPRASRTPFVGTRSLDPNPGPGPNPGSPPATGSVSDFDAGSRPTYGRTRLENEVGRLYLVLSAWFVAQLS